MPLQAENKLYQGDAMKRSEINEILGHTRQFFPVMMFICRRLPASRP